MLKKKFLVCSIVAIPLITWYAIGLVNLPDKQPLPFSRDVELIRYFNKKGFGLSMRPNKSLLWTQDIQLCIMFNSVHKSKTVGLLLSYYLQFFDHITLLFSGQGPLKKPHYAPDTVQALGCDSYYGWYQHKCLNICLSHADDHIRGFLYIADDMFINITKMGELDPSKIWCQRGKRYNYSKLTAMSKAELHKHKWYWFGFPHYNEEKLKRVVDSFPHKWIERLKQNTGFPNDFEIQAPLDIIYIPRSLASPMMEVLTFITNTTYSLFCELAGPLAVGIVAQPSQKLQLSVHGYLWGKSRTLTMKREKAKTEHFVHPIKVGKSTGDAKLWQSLMREVMKASATTIGTTLT